MSTNTKKLKCPDTECVSAYFDGELSAESAEFAHIKECQECQKCLKSYQVLADKLKEEFAVATPGNLSDRIIAGVKKRSHINSGKNIINFSMLLRVAALFVISAFALFLMLPGNTPENNRPTETTPTPEFLNIDIPQRSMTTMKFPSRDRIAADNGSIDLKDFFPASTSARRKINFVDDDATEKPAFIPKNVKQVWVVKDLDSGIRQFAKFAENNNIKKTTKKNKGNIEVNLKLTKLQLVELVRQCHNAGFKLLSPSQPQPEQTTFAGNKDDIVNYQALFTDND